jgi:peptide-methionine (R)-S-oxide reductase
MPRESHFCGFFDFLAPPIPRKSGLHRGKKSRQMSSTKATEFIGFLRVVACTAYTVSMKRIQEDEAKPIANTPEEVTIVEFDDSGERRGTVQVLKIVKEESEWTKELPALTCEVTRRAGTERAFTGQYWNQHEKGIYRCVCCGTALFTSDSKFDSGTGWPSFWQPIANENVATHEDVSYGMRRIEVVCRRCDAHLGHVFPDGPRPTGLRYCMNSASMKFIKTP